MSKGLNQSKFEKLTEELIHLGEDKNELEKWNQVFNSLPLSTQKGMVELFEQQLTRLKAVSHHFV